MLEFKILFNFYAIDLISKINFFIKMEIPYLKNQSAISFYSSVIHSENHQMAFWTPPKSKAVRQGWGLPEEIRLS